MQIKQTKPFDVVMSLGVECQARYNISRTLWFRRHQTFDGFFLASDCNSGGDWGTFLFDWSFAPTFNPLIKLLQHDLAGSFSEGVELKTRHDGSQTVIDHFSGLQYPHQFSGTPEGTATFDSVSAELALTQDKFDYLAEKTRRVLDSPGHALFVYCGEASDNELRELLSRFKKRVKSFLLLYVPWTGTGSTITNELQDECLLIRPCRFETYPGDLNAWHNIFAGLEFAFPDAHEVKRLNAPVSNRAEKKDGMKVSVSIHSLYWNNTKELYHHHKKVMDHLNIPVNYYNLDEFDHGQFITDILAKEQHDVIGFLDIDCIPKNRGIVEKSIEWVVKNDSFIGLAQVSNHIKPATHVFAAPSFFFITKNCYERLGKPSCNANYRSDVIEELSYVADEKGITYKCIYPLYYEKNPLEGKWRLGNYGYFGIGCHYPGGIYNLYQGRREINNDLFKTRCKNVLENESVNEEVIFCAEPLFNSPTDALYSELYKQVTVQEPSDQPPHICFQPGTSHCRANIEMLPPHNPEHWENFADNIGLNEFDLKNRRLRLKFQLVSLFNEAAIQRFWLTCAEGQVQLMPKNAGSPHVGERHTDLAWSAKSRFIVDEVVLLPDTFANVSALDLTAEVCGVHWKIGEIQVISPRDLE